MTKLKDCPFCGGEAKIYRLAKQWSVSCSCCEAEIARNTMDCNTTCQVQKRRIDAINIWNNRHDTLTEQNKQLVESFQVLIHEMKQELVRGSYAVDTESGSSMVISIPALNGEISKITRALIDDDYMNSILAKHKDQTK